MMAALLGRTAAHEPPDEDYRWIYGAGPCQQAAEVSVRGDKHTLFLAGAFEGGFIGRGLHGEVTHMDGVVPGRLQRIG